MENLLQIGENFDRMYGVVSKYCTAKQLYCCQAVSEVKEIVACQNAPFSQRSARELKKLASALAWLPKQGAQFYKLAASKAAKSLLHK